MEKIQLNPKYNYVAFDLETTGLNKNEDEIIQIAIVKFDENGKILKKFNSLVHPEKNTIETFISFLTGINNDAIKSAPLLEELKTEILSFFDENTLLIGHNIQFDIDFLQRYFPELPYFDKIDTYWIAKHFVHFPSSYALEVLVELLKEKEESFKNILDAMINEEEQEKHHDAMTDTINSIALFVFCIDRIGEILDKNPTIMNLFSKLQDGLWKDLLILPSHWRSKIIGNISLPSLSNSKIGEVKMLADEHTIPLDKIDENASFFVGNMEFKTVLQRLAGNKNIVLCFDTMTKLTIAKKILTQLGITQLGSIYDEQIINKEKLVKFLNKEEFSVDELFFVLKYLSTRKAGYSILQLNSPIDYKIMWYIHQESNFEKSNIVLATHNAFFANKDNKKLQGYDIAFFDSDYWYKNYNNYLCRNIDGYALVYVLENILYTCTINKNTERVKKIQYFYERVLMFVGFLSLESKKLIDQVNTYQIQVNPIVGNTDFEQTNQIWEEILQQYPDILKICEKEEQEEIQKKFEEIEQILNTVITVSKRINYNSPNQDEYFVFSESVKFTDWSEFIEIFNNYHSIFFSNFNKINKKLDEKSEFHSGLSLKREQNNEKIFQEIIEDPSSSGQKVFFILSTRKVESQKIFNILITREEFQDYELLAENITGGAGKNIFKTKRSDKVVIIGGYQFLLNLYAHEILPQKIFIHNIYGNMEKQILSDILRYANNRNNNI